MTPGMDAQSYKTLYSKVLDVLNFLIARKHIIKIFFVFVFFCIQREDAHRLITI